MNQYSYSEAREYNKKVQTQMDRIKKAEKQGSVKELKELKSYSIKWFGFADETEWLHNYIEKRLLVLKGETK